MRTTPILLLVLAGVLTAYAQPKAAELSFDVASIKVPAPPGQSPALLSGVRGGPGSNDPRHATFGSYPMYGFIMFAYELKSYQLDVRDSRLQQEFDISVGIPEGATRAQFQMMMRTLLAERFHLRIHREKKTIDVYDLVQAKGGHRLKPPSTPGEVKPLANPIEKDESNLPKMSPGRTMMACNAAGCRMQRIADTLDRLITQLSVELLAPVNDATGLTGQKFDYLLTWGSSTISTNATTDAPPPLASAINDQLGLRLERSKSEVDALIVDSVDRQPTEN